MSVDMFCWKSRAKFLSERNNQLVCSMISHFKIVVSPMVFNALLCASFVQVERAVTSCTLHRLSTEGVYPSLCHVFMA